MRMTKWGVFALAAAVVAATVHHQHAKSRAPVTDPPPTRVVEVPKHLRLTGTIVALHSATLTAPRIEGSRSGLNRGGDAMAQRGGADFSLVLLSLAKPGSRVKTGDVVAQFDPQSQQDRLDDYKDTVLQMQNTIQGMTANLAALKEAHDQSVRQAKSAWEQALLDLQTAPALSDIDAEKGRLAVEEAEAAYKQLVEEASLVDQSQQAQIRVSELNLQQARIELERAASNVEKMTMRAPIDGLIVMSNIVRNGEYAQIREGDQISARQPFLSVVDPSAMALDATVNQVDAEKLTVGAKATVRLDAYPQVQLTGTLIGVGAMARPSTFRGAYVSEIPVRIRIDRADAHLIPDLSGSAEIALE